VEPFQQHAIEIARFAKKTSNIINLHGQICAISVNNEAFEITSLFMRSMKGRFLQKRDINNFYDKEKPGQKIFLHPIFDFLRRSFPSLLSRSWSGRHTRSGVRTARSAPPNP
jgi:hypothetical protein